MDGIEALGIAAFGATSVDFVWSDPEFAAEPRIAGEAAALAPDVRLSVLRDGRALLSPRGDAMHAPLRFGEAVGGVASIYRHAGGAFDGAEAIDFEKWTRLFSVRFHELHLRAGNARLEQLAGIDGLTGICNRRTFGDMLSRAWQRSLQAGTPIAIAMIDIDYFKAFNDTYGHVAGDACLRNVAEAVTSALRQGDVVGRYGGEEFVAFFENVSLEGAIPISERLREGILALDRAHSGSSLGRVSASVGVAAAVPQPGDDAATLLERADHALYGAKARGRNKVVAESYVSVSQAALPRHASLTNLPNPTSSFCEREAESARVRTAFDASRFVALTGFGGVGKSRLALAIARDAIGSYRDGVWYVDLAGSRDAESIREALTVAMGMRDSSSAESLGAFAEYCADKDCLLLLDNCEHLKHACAAFATAILSAAPKARVLATSREPLDHPDVVVVPIGPFSLPPSEKVGAVEASQYPAVRLFVDRARAVTSFELRDDNATAVVDLCRRVDGIALGIELAAARLKVLTLEQLRTKLDRRFDLLGRNDPESAERGQTLRAVIDWSFGLLGDSERTLLRRLGIFSGAFTFEAAKSVCGAESSDVATLEAVDALVDKSLVVVEADFEDRRTFRLFRSIRSFARDQLSESGELEALTTRHGDYFVGIAKGACALQSTPQWSAAFAPLEFAADDVRAVLERTLGERRAAAVGAEFALALIEFWRSCGAMREARSWIACALASADETFSEDLRVRLRLAMLDVENTGDAAVALEQARDVLASIEAGSADRELLGAAFFRIGSCHRNLRDMEHSHAFLEAARAESERCENGLLSARVANALGIALASIGGENEAIAQFNEAERLYLRIGRHDLTANPLCNLAAFERIRGRYEEAIAVGKRALAIAERSQNRAIYGLLLSNLGSCYLSIRDLDLAQAFALDGLRIAGEVEDSWLVGATCDVYARVLCARGDVERSARVLGFVDRLWESLNMPRQADEDRDTQALRAALERELGGARLAECMAEGRNTSVSGMLVLLDSGFAMSRTGTSG